jgi:hypothetical protein
MLVPLCHYTNYSMIVAFGSYTRTDTHYALQQALTPNILMYIGSPWS